MDPIQGTVAIITALGLGTVVPMLLKGAFSHVTGKAERERTATQTALSERDSAWERESAVRHKLIVFQTYASRLRRMMIEWGIPEDKIPAWPESKESR